MNSVPALSLHYSMQIRWSPDDQAYIVALPEWKGRLFNYLSATHGATYEDAARNGRDVLELLIEDAQEAGVALPSPLLYDDPYEPAEVETQGGASR